MTESPSSDRQLSLYGAGYDQVIIEKLRAMTAEQWEVIDQLWKGRGTTDLHTRLRRDLGLDRVQAVLCLVQDLQQEFAWTYDFVINNLYIYLCGVRHLPRQSQSDGHST